MSSVNESQKPTGFSRGSVTRVCDLIDPVEITITTGDTSCERVEEFIISSIPGFYAIKLHAKMLDLIQRRLVGDIPNEIVLELLKYAAREETVLDSEEVVNANCFSAEIIIAVAMEVWKRNFSFLKTRQFPRLHGGSGENSGLVGYSGIDPLIGYIIHRGHASLWDCKHRYSYEELYDIWEADAVPEDNSATIQRRAIDQAKLKKGIYQ